jgi:hypothetical protein
MGGVVITPQLHNPSLISPCRMWVDLIYQSGVLVACFSLLIWVWAMWTKPKERSPSDSLLVTHHDGMCQCLCRETGAKCGFGIDFVEFKNVDSPVGQDILECSLIDAIIDKASLNIANPASFTLVDERIAEELYYNFDVSPTSLPSTSRRKTGPKNKEKNKNKNRNKNKKDTSSEHWIERLSYHQWLWKLRDMQQLVSTLLPLTTAASSTSTSSTASAYSPALLVIAADGQEQQHAVAENLFLLILATYALGGVVHLWNGTSSDSYLHQLAHFLTLPQSHHPILCMQSQQVPGLLTQLSAIAGRSTCTSTAAAASTATASGTARCWYWVGSDTTEGCPPSILGAQPLQSPLSPLSPLSSTVADADDPSPSEPVLLTLPHTPGITPQRHWLILWREQASVSNNDSNSNGSSNDSSNDSNGNSSNSSGGVEYVLEDRVALLAAEALRSVLPLTSDSRLGTCTSLWEPATWLLRLAAVLGGSCWCARGSWQFLSGAVVAAPASSWQQVHPSGSASASATATFSHSHRWIEALRQADLTRGLIIGDYPPLPLLTAAISSSLPYPLSHMQLLLPLGGQTSSSSSSSSSALLLYQHLPIPIPIPIGGRWNGGSIRLVPASSHQVLMPRQWPQVLIRPPWNTLPQAKAYLSATGTTTTSSTATGTATDTTDLQRVHDPVHAQPVAWLHVPQQGLLAFPITPRLPWAGFIALCLQSTPLIQDCYCQWSPAHQKCMALIIPQRGALMALLTQQRLENSIRWVDRSDYRELLKKKVTSRLVTAYIHKHCDAYFWPEQQIGQFLLLEEWPQEVVDEAYGLIPAAVEEVFALEFRAMDQLLGGQ